MNYQSISPAELAKLRQARSEMVLLDVRLPEDFAAEHLPEAVNNCVFEVQFLHRMKDVAPSLESPICCYGNAAGSLESRMAVEKLRRAGYREIFDLADGVLACVTAGLPTVRTEPAPAPAPPRDGIHVVDLAESWVEWIGRNLLKAHQGRIGLRRGALSLQGGGLAGGEFAFDMSAITCHDLAGSPLHDVLVAHLRSDDFFDTELFPEATLTMGAATMSVDATPGSQNLTVSGELTLKGITAPIRFSASAGVTPDGRLAAQADFDFDRTRWNVLYGSGRFFQRLGGHLVNDVIGIRLRIVTLPTPAKHE